MNCNQHNKQHCHKCEKAKHWDFYFVVWSVAMSLFVLWISDGEAWKYIIWPWVFLLVLWIGKYFIDKEEKQKKEKEQEQQLEWEKKFEAAEKDLASGKKEAELEKKDEDEKIKL